MAWIDVQLQIIVGISINMNMFTNVLNKKYVWLHKYVAWKVVYIPILYIYCFHCLGCPCHNVEANVYDECQTTSMQRCRPAAYWGLSSKQHLGCSTCGTNSQLCPGVDGLSSAFIHWVVRCFHFSPRKVGGREGPFIHAFIFFSLLLL